ncbi:MAG: tryptophan--tRNA ligase [Candidatus Peribacteraceae bacterium]|nr:tryptophan--tRNA ligase [Candidatus Peribacteraceae bacterium]
MRILSGIQPSGSLHLGNYFGALEQFLGFQEKGAELFIFVADLHALTTTKNPEELKKNIFEVAAAYIALGLTSEKTVLYRQSDVPETLELNWILSCLAPMGLLERAVSFKDKTAKGLEANVGLFNYPILQAADILIMQPDKVPVGRDQKQHLEITRDLADKFNSAFGETLKLPDPEIPKKVAVVPGTDGEKMSKSYGNTIELFADAAELKKQVFRIQTDSTPKGQPLDYAKCKVFQIFKLLANEAEETDLAEKYRNGEVGYGDAKQILLDKILEKFGPARAKFAKLQKNPGEVEKVLASGAKQARAEAQKNLAAIRKKVGLDS